MTVSFATFDRLKGKGVAAYKSGDFLVAKSYLVDAAECMIEMASSAKSPETQRQHEELAAELIDLAKDCDAAHAQGRKAGGGNGRRGQREKEGDSGADASDWIVKDKPTLGFDDIAGLEDVKQEATIDNVVAN